MKVMFAVCLVAATAGTAHAKDARCELVVDGKTWISGSCDFKALGSGDGSFMITGENDYFAYANWDGKAMRGSWNGPGKASRAHDDLGTLSRDKNDKGCWVNESARICAW